MQLKLYKSVIIFLVTLLAIVLVIAGLNSYPGSKWIYLLFSAVFWLMLFTAMGRSTHYGYIFLATALWLGFWGKITAHLLLKYPYVEPIGRFDGSATAWDSVLWVSIMASIGVMSGKLLFTLIKIKYSRIVGLNQAKSPVWYPVIRMWVWPLSLTMIIGMAALNLMLGIQQIGLVPRTILPWPLNALIAWQVSMGSALLLTVLLWWEITSKRSISLSIYALLIEAITSTTSLLSRGIYIFHTIPQFFSLYENRRQLVGVSKIKVVVLVLVFAGLMVLSISGVTTFRAYLYPRAGGFTTADQIRLTRLEVIEGGIANVKKLIAQGEPQEGHLRELLAEKLKIKEQQQLARLEVLEGGIDNVKTLISQGEAQEGHLRELLAEKGRLEISLSKKEATQEMLFRNALAEIEEQRRLARLEVLEGGIASVKDLIPQGEPQAEHLRELQNEKIRLEKILPSHDAKNNDMTTGDRTGKIENILIPASISAADSLSENKEKLIKEFYTQISTGSLLRILSLVVDRWIGLEGVMAVSAYPEKSNKLLLDAITEKRGIGTTTKFQEIANSHYRWVDANFWQFASLPGAAAFFYFSGSLWMVMLGMAIFALVLQSSEQLIFRLTSNPLLCSMFGLTFANTITQFGVTPRQDIPFYSMIFGFVILVWIVQSDKVSGMYIKYVDRGKRGLV